MLNGLTPRQQQLKEFDQKNGKASTFYLGRRVLGYQLCHQPHREICSFLDTKKFIERKVKLTTELVQTNKNKLLLAPRGCYKTSILSQIYVVRRILNDPNIRILLDSVALTNSQDNLRVVRRAFEGNAKLIELYGDFHGKQEPWNDTEFTVCKRTNMRLAAPTVRASGIDKVQIGPHYDLIIADDLHNRENTREEVQVQKVKDHIRLVFGLLDPGGEFIIGGHRWSYKDAYTMVMGETDRPEEVEFASLFAGEVFKRGARYPDGSLYFPAKHDEAHLTRQRVALGAETYAAMLDNEPAMVGPDAKFSVRYFKRFKEPLQLKDEKTGGWLPKMNWYLTIDPGGSKKGNNFWVIFEGGMDSSGNQYFTRYLKKISKVTQAAEDVYRWWMQRKAEGRPYQAIGFETSGQQGQMLESMKDYLWEKYQVQLKFVPLNHSDSSKEGRIEAMGPKYENGKIFHSAQMSEPFGLEDQLVKYTKAEDDVADAAGSQEEVARAPRVAKVEREPASMDEMIQKNIEDRFSGKTKITRTHPILGSDF